MNKQGGFSLRFFQWALGYYCDSEDFAQFFLFVCFLTHEKLWLMTVMPYDFPIIMNPFFEGGLLIKIP